MKSDCTQTNSFEFSKNRDAWVYQKTNHHCLSNFTSRIPIKIDFFLIITEAHSKIRFCPAFNHPNWLAIRLGYLTNANQPNVYVSHLLLVWYFISETWNWFDSFWCITRCDGTGYTEQNFFLANPNECTIQIYIIHLFFQRLCVCVATK